MVTEQDDEEGRRLGRRRTSGTCGSTWPARRRGRSPPSPICKKICEEHLAGQVPDRSDRPAEEPATGQGRPDPGRADAGAEAPGAGAEDHRRPVQHRTRPGGPGPAAAETLEGTTSHGDREKRNDRHTAGLREGREGAPQPQTVRAAALRRGDQPAVLGRHPNRSRRSARSTSRGATNWRSSTSTSSRRWPRASRSSPPRR